MVGHLKRRITAKFPNKSFPNCLTKESDGDSMNSRQNVPTPWQSLFVFTVELKTSVRATKRHSPWQKFMSSIKLVVSSLGNFPRQPASHSNRKSRDTKNSVAHTGSLNEAPSQVRAGRHSGALAFSPRRSPRRRWCDHVFGRYHRDGVQGWIHYRSLSARNLKKIQPDITPCEVNYAARPKTLAFYI